ncbi:MAG: hypothetical protein WD077_11805 [Bacteroidia bacterium]
MIGFAWRKYHLFLPQIIFIFFFYACDSGRYDVDVSHIEAPIEVKRFEVELFNIPEENFEKEIVSLQEKYPEMFRFYVEHLLRAGSVEKESYVENLKKFVYDPYMRELYNDQMAQFRKFDQYEQEIEEGMRHVKYYYPKDTLPAIFTIITGMTYQVVTFEGAFIAISPDMFLGADYKFYPSRDYYNYQMRRFRPEYIDAQVLKAYYSMKFPEAEYVDNTLLSEMIYQGKMLFWLDVMAPEMDDTIKIEYTGEQLEWAQENEGEMYQHFVQEELFYITKQVIKDRYMRDAPFTIAEGVPQESSPRLGEYLGWQIVRNYMDDNDAVTVQELFADKNYQKIFDRSRYKPRL